MLGNLKSEIRICKKRKRGLSYWLVTLGLTEVNKLIEILVEAKHGQRVPPVLKMIAVKGQTFLVKFNFGYPCIHILWLVRKSVRDRWFEGWLSVEPLILTQFFLFNTLRGFNPLKFAL